MKRALVSGFALCLALSPAYAASPKIDHAVSVFKAVSADSGKLKTFCAMTKVMDAAGDKEDAATDQKIADLMKQLGPDFETAWNAGEGVDENSADGKALNAALDDLMNKCS
jgi:protoporphyrinogen oxidase